MGATLAGNSCRSNKAAATQLDSPLQHWRCFLFAVFCFVCCLHKRFWANYSFLLCEFRSVPLHNPLLPSSFFMASHILRQLCFLSHLRPLPYWRNENITRAQFQVSKCLPAEIIEWKWVRISFFLLHSFIFYQYADTRFPRGTTVTRVSKNKHRQGTIYEIIFALKMRGQGK